MKSKKKKIDAFLVLYIIYIVDSVLSESKYIDISTINAFLIGFRYMTLFGTMLLALKKQRYIKVKLFFISVVVLAMAVITALFFNGGISALFIIFIALASEGVNAENIIKTTIITLVLSYIFVIISSQLHIIPDVIGVRHIGNAALLSGEYLRHAMGFMVSNQIPTTFFMVYILIIAWKKDSIPWWFNLSIGFLNIYIFSLFGSRLVFIITFVCIATYYMVFISNKLHNNRPLPLEKALPYSFIALALLSFLLSSTRLLRL